MKTSNQVIAAADQLVRAHRTRAPFEALAETAPTGVDEAYAIQDDVATLTGAAGRE